MSMILRSMGSDTVCALWCFWGVMGTELDSSSDDDIADDSEFDDDDDDLMRTQRSLQEGLDFCVCGLIAL